MVICYIFQDKNLPQHRLFLLFGQRPRRGLSLVEHRGNLSVCPFVPPSAPSSGLWFLWGLFWLKFCRKVQIQAIWPKYKLNGPNPSTMAWIQAKWPKFLALSPSFWPLRPILWPLIPNFWPDLGQFAWIQAIMLGCELFCLYLGHIAWIWAFRQNLSQNRPQRNQSPEDGAEGGTNGQTDRFPLCSTRLNYGKKKFCGKQKLSKTILNVIRFS